MTTSAITGATGELGRRVAQRLGDRGLSQRLVVRDPSRAPKLPGADIAISPGYHDRAAMTAAFTGADTVFLVSGRESATRVEEHLSAIDAAVDAGVRRIVYTSFLGAAPDCTFTLSSSWPGWNLTLAMPLISSIERHPVDSVRNGRVSIRPDRR